MTLTKELVERFQQLHFIKFSEHISYGKAEQELKELAELVRIISQKEK